MPILPILCGGCGLVIGLLLIVWLFGSRLLSLFDKSGKIIFHGEENNMMGKKRIAITIDDVPWKYSLPKALKKQEKKLLGSSSIRLETSIVQICSVLKRVGGCATLMMIGNYAIRNLKHNQELLNEFVEWMNDGVIELANHGMTNGKHASLSRECLKEEIVKNEETLNELLLEKVNEKKEDKVESVMTKFYRPGHGYFTSEMIDLVDQLGYRIVLGNIYSFDPMIPVWWLNYLNIVVVTYLYDVLKFITFGWIGWKDDQAIVILHDRPWTATLLIHLIPFLKWRGYEIVSLSKITEKN